jgi:hypothetical protein
MVSQFHKHTTSREYPPHGIREKLCVASGHCILQQQRNGVCRYLSIYTSSPRQPYLDMRCHHQPPIFLSDWSPLSFFLVPSDVMPHHSCLGDFHKKRNQPRMGPDCSTPPRPFSRCPLRCWVPNNQTPCQTFPVKSSMTVPSLVVSNTLQVQGTLPEAGNPLKMQRLTVSHTVGYSQWMQGGRGRKQTK